MYDKTFSVVLDKRELLRVKLKNLAQEAALIRREENKILWDKSAVRAFDRELNGAFLRNAGVLLDADMRMLRGLRKARRRAVGDYALYLELHAHRVKHVRHHARMAHLAYGAIRGRTLAQMEGPGAVLLDADKREVQRMFKAYGAKGAPVPDWMAIKPPVFVAVEVVQV